MKNLLFVIFLNLCALANTSLAEQWEFNTFQNREGWRTEDCGVIASWSVDWDGNGAFVILVDGQNPYIVNDPLSINAANYNTVRIAMVSHLNTGNGAVSFKTSALPNYDSNKKTFSVNHDNKLYVYDIVVGAHLNWQGTIKGLRIAPATEAHSNIAFDYIRLVDEPANRPQLIYFPSGGLKFGNVIVGQQKEDTIQITNQGISVLRVTSASLVGSHANQFSIISGGGAFNVQKGNSRLIKVRFKPTSVGTKNASLRIISNDPSWPTLDIPLKGTGGIHTVTATIDSISPKPAEQGQSVSFNGHGTCSLGHSIVEYNWRSSRDGYLSNSSSFSKSNLSVGTHTIYFKVKCSAGIWSSEDADSIQIIPQKQVAVTITPQNKTINVNEYTTIEVLIADVTNFGGFELRLRYNPNIIEINGENVQKGNFVSSNNFHALGPHFQNVSSFKELTYGVSFLGQQPGPSGSGSLARITVKGVGVGTTSLELKDVLIIDASSDMNQPIVNTTDGAIIVRGQPPVANFTGNPREGCASLTVNFADLSENNPSSWSWSFGDGGTSTQRNPSHTYTNPGTYTVSLTATNSSGSDTETKTNYITVRQRPAAKFSATPTNGCASLTVQFTDQSTGNPTSWNWTFGDGGTSTAQNPSYTYTNPGTYTVSLTVSNQCGLDTETKTDYITVLPKPSADFVGTPTKGEAPLTVQFTDNSTGNPTSWSWNFGDGGTSTQQNPSHTYTNPGTYTISLTATNDCGSDIETKSDYIEVKHPKNADFTWSSESPKEDEEVQFTDQSTPQEGIVSWSWDFGDGNTSTEQNPKHTYTQANNPSQTFSVTLTVEWSDGESDTETKSVEVHDKEPLAQFHWEPLDPEVGKEVQFFDDSESYDGIASREWNFGDGGTSTEPNPRYTYTNDGTYTINLTVEEADGDTDTESKDIVISCFFADVNCDNQVNVFDVLLVATAWGTSDGDPDYQAEYDLNEDGSIDIEDLTMVAEYWGEEAPFELMATPSLASLDTRSVILQANSPYIKVGDTACFDVITEGDSPIRAFELRLSYDAAILEFKEAELGQVFLLREDKNSMITLGPKLDKSKGEILYGGIRLGYDSHTHASGTIAHLAFMPRQVSELQLDISYLKLVDAQWRLLPITIKKQIPQMIMPQAPKTSALLQNYPNPFNPETCIPYQLSKNADVTIRIYNIKGQLIRQISLGHKQAGSYLDKRGAAYWDGKNNAGEKIASGMYFYQLQSEDFRAMRRMMIVK